MANSNIELEISELFRYLNIPWTPNNIQDESKNEDLEIYKIPANGDIISKHHPVSQGGFATPTHPLGHEGLDIANQIGTPIYSMGPGIVTKIYDEGSNKGGNAVVISHEDGKLTSYYAHLKSILVSLGDVVNQSTQIGTMGISGNARGSSHLHWHVRLNGTPIDPTKIIGKQVGYLKEASIKIKLKKLAINFSKLVNCPQD